MLDSIYPASHNKYLKKAISSYRELITFVQDRPGHDRRYAIDPSKIEKEPGWKAEERFAKCLYNTVARFMEKYV